MYSTPSVSNALTNKSDAFMIHPQTVSSPHNRSRDSFQCLRILWPQPGNTVIQGDQIGIPAYHFSGMF